MKKEQFKLIPYYNILTLRIKDEYDYSLKVPFTVPKDFELKESIAAIIHIYYTELLGEIISHINNIPATTDLYISTDSEEKKSIFKNNCNITVKAKSASEFFSTKVEILLPVFLDLGIY